MKSTILVLCLFFPFSQLWASDKICQKDDLNYPSDLPHDFRWSESEINKASALEAIGYLSNIANGDVSQFHEISLSHAQLIIEGYAYKLLALEELKNNNGKKGHHVSEFCGWVSNAVKAD